jgi:hypothetical protein
MGGESRSAPATLLSIDLRGKETLASQRSAWESFVAAINRITEPEQA